MTKVKDPVCQKQNANNYFMILQYSQTIIITTDITGHLRQPVYTMISYFNNFHFLGFVPTIKFSLVCLEHFRNLITIFTVMLLSSPIPNFKQVELLQSSACTLTFKPGIIIYFSFLEGAWRDILFLNALVCYY